MAFHAMREGHTPNTPAVRFRWADRLEVEFLRDFPHQSCAAIVGSDHKSVAVVAALSLKICDFPKCESINRDSMDDLKTVIDRSARGPCNESRLVLRSARGGVVNCEPLSDWGRRFLPLIAHGRNANTDPSLLAAWELVGLAPGKRFRFSGPNGSDFVLAVPVISENTRREKDPKRTLLA
jgi:hypothetical protein